MCGIFGFIGDRPDEDLFRLAVKGAARRGPDAHGWWWTYPGRDFEATYHAPGPLDPAYPPSVPVILGHARLATMGTHGEEGTQPIVTEDGHVLLHNGNVRNWRDLAYGVATDSFALAQVYSENRAFGLDPREALGKTMSEAVQVAHVVVILDREGRLVTSRKALPLYRLATENGLYLSSGRLPGASQIPEYEVTDLGTVERISQCPIN